jgi:hypothetical protein
MDEKNPALLAQMIKDSAVVLFPSATAEFSLLNSSQILKLNQFF